MTGMAGSKVHVLQFRSTAESFSKLISVLNLGSSYCPHLGHLISAQGFRNSYVVPQHGEEPDRVLGQRQLLVESKKG